MEVALAETPAPVQAAIQKQLSGGALKSIEENFDPAGNSFDVVDIGKDGVKGAFSIGADGGLLSLQVTLDQVIPIARDTIQKTVGDGTIKSIDESFDPPVNTYDVVAVMKRRHHENPSPWARGATHPQRGGHHRPDHRSRAGDHLASQIGDGKIIRIDKAYAEKKEDGVVPFEVQGRKDGVPFNFSVGPKGKFLGDHDESGQQKIFPALRKIARAHFESHPSIVKNSDP